MTLSRSITTLLILGSALFGASPCLALDWAVNAHVVWVESTYAPTYIITTIDQPAGSCGVGGNLIYNATGTTIEAQVVNYDANFAVLLSAKLTGTTVTVYGLNSDCQI